MHRKLLPLILLLMLLLAVCSGSKALKESSDTNEELRNEDFIGKRLAFATGEAFDTLFLENVGDFEAVHCNYEHEAMELVKNGRADALMLDEPMARKWVSINPELTIVNPPFAEYGFGAIFSKDTEELRFKFNEFLKEIKANGVYDDMIARWIDTVDSPPMPEIPLNGTKGVLKFASNGELEPFGYIVNGQPEGFDIELAKRFAAYMDMDLDISLMAWEALIPYVNAGKADFGACLFIINEEREQFVSFSDPYYTGGAVIVTKKTSSEGLAIKDESSTGFWDRLKSSVENNLLKEDRWKLVMEGLKVSLTITIFAFALATLLGFGICGLCMSKNSLLRAIGSVYVTVMRGTPIVVLLMITFYVIFAKSSVSGTMVAIFAFGANGAAFIGEILRSAIMTVDKGQVEAARSMGFSKVGAFFTVTFPQAVQVAFPTYMSEFVSTFKETAVVGYIAIVDLTKAGDIIRSRTYDALFPLVMVALVYMLAASVIIWIFNRIYRRTNKRLRRVKG
jgi:polar amino acid transport system substrate-binding protein